MTTLNYVAFRVALHRMRRSSTLWFNSIVGLLALVEPNLHLLQPMLGGRYEIVLFAVVIINGFLRLKTEVKHVKANIEGTTL